MVFEKIQEIIADQFDIDADEITESTDLFEELDADSLDMIDIAMSIEDEFRIEVPDEDLENLKTVGDIVEFIEQK